jgi:hypothetical protein
MLDVILCGLGISKLQLLSQIINFYSAVNFFQFFCINLTLNRSANLVFLTFLTKRYFFNQVSSFKFAKTGRFMSQTFCILDVLYPDCFVSWTFYNWTFGNWTFCILDVSVGDPDRYSS